jgi:hypothetical protein
MLGGRADNTVAPKKMIAVECTLAPAAGKSAATSRRQTRIGGFHPSYRRFVAELTSCAPELEDLADSFPALLFALVSGFATPARRARACELVCDGAPLREAADALGLAWWLRKLPADAFSEPLPSFPTDPEFALRIASLIPREARRRPIWLARVGHAYECGGEAYALWIARQADLGSPPEDVFLFMAAWAWFSSRPGHMGHRLLRRPWTSEMSFKRARDEVTAWRQRLRLIEYLGPGIETPWLADGIASGYSFVALRTADDFVSESVALENCLDQYADRLHSGLTAIFSIRRGARRVGCVEIGLHSEEATMPTIVQLRGPRNRRASPEVWQATFGWIGSQRLAPLSPRRHAPAPIKRLEARRHLWRPYLEFLTGSRHEPAFRRAAFQRPRMPSRGRRAPLEHRHEPWIAAGAMRREREVHDAVPDSTPSLPPERA